MTLGRKIRQRDGTLGAALNDFDGETDRHTSVLKHDVVAGTTTVQDLGAGRVGGEFVFVPADDESSGEDEGWLMGYVYDHSTDTSDLVILLRTVRAVLAHDGAV